MKVGYAHCHRNIDRKGDDYVMEIEPKTIIEFGAYGVVLFVFVMLIKYLLKNLSDDLSKITKIVEEDADNTKELKDTIANHLTTSVNKLGEKIEKLGEKIEKL